MTNEFKAPTPFWDRDYSKLVVFLAGTIDMGNSADWQQEAAYKLTEKFIVLNPRRENWDSSWEQSMDNHQFSKQVEWELDGLDHSDYILVNFLPGSQSPISFLELGAYHDTGKVHVVCPKGFYRKGNIDIFCHRHGIPVYNTLDEAIDFLMFTKEQDESYL